MIATKNSWVFKIVIGGDGGIGKTALVQRYVKGTFSINNQMTIGAQHYSKDCIIATDIAHLQIWDFAGEERFRFLLSDYCRGASGAILCYDVTDYDTFTNLVKWLTLIRSSCDAIPVLFVGTKTDLPNIEVDAKVASEYAQQCGCIGSVQCSSKDNLNVNDIFAQISQAMINAASANE